jgi:ABC-2 type transport system permease protein
MSTFEAVRLVAMREIRERFRSRAFRVSSLIAAGVVAALIIVPNVRDEVHTYDVGVVGVTDPVILATIRNSGPAIGGNVAVHNVGSAAQARTRLRSGALDVVLVDGRELIVNKPLNPDRVNARYRLAAAVSEAARLQTALTDAGLPSEKAAEILKKPPLPVQALGKPQPDQTDQVTVFVGVIATLFFLLQYGAWILVGVAEEKSSRVAEVLLAAVRPRQLVAGKVIGIGLIGLAQALFVAGTALVSSRAIGSNVLGGANALDALAAVGWFVLGISFYGWAYAAAGSLVARQSDAQVAGAPITFPMYAGYVASTFALNGEPSPVLRVLAFFPPTTPFCMPTLIALNDVAPWQVALSVVMLILAGLLMARLAGAIYANSILRSGKRIKWMEALRSA